MDSLSIELIANTIEYKEAIICVAIAIIISILGNGLLSLIIIYEKYTMDPQKRTVINQLVSHACQLLLIHNFVGIPLMTYVIIVDDAGKSYPIVTYIPLKLCSFNRTYVGTP